VTIEDLFKAYKKYEQEYDADGRKRDPIGVPCVDEEMNCAEVPSCL
jgi:hypothetical protein